MNAVACRACAGVSAAEEITHILSGRYRRLGSRRPRPVRALHAAHHYANSRAPLAAGHHGARSHANSQCSPDSRLRRVPRASAHTEKVFFTRETHARVSQQVPNKSDLKQKLITIVFKKKNLNNNKHVHSARKNVDTISNRALS